MCRIFFVGLSLLISSVSASQANDKIDPQSIVYLEVEGQVAGSSVPVINRGTGFIITDDGLVFTAKHLLFYIDRQGQNPRLVPFHHIRSIKGRLASADNSPDFDLIPVYPLDPVKHDVSRGVGVDLARLKIQPTDTLNRFAPVSLCVGYRPRDRSSEKITAYGFPRNEQRYFPFPGSFHFEANLVWKASMGLDRGVSGGPVTNAFGDVIAVVRSGAPSRIYSNLTPIVHAIEAMIGLPGEVLNRCTGSKFAGVQFRRQSDASTFETMDGPTEIEITPQYSVNPRSCRFDEMMDEIASASSISWDSDKRNKELSRVMFSSLACKRFDLAANAQNKISWDTDFANACAGRIIQSLTSDGRWNEARALARGEGVSFQLHDENGQALTASPTRLTIGWDSAFENQLKAFTNHGELTGVLQERLLMCSPPAFD